MPDIESNIIRSVSDLSDACSALLSPDQIHDAMKRTADLQRLLVRFLAGQQGDTA